MIRAAAVGLVVVASGACALDATTEDPTGDRCTQDTECVDGTNACTIGHCAGGLCAHDPVPDGFSPPQIAGDCEVLACADGAEQRTADPTDADDANTCTVDSCENGVAEHMNLALAAVCFTGSAQGECDGMGACIVQCSDVDPCPIDPGQPCGDPMCDDENECVYPPLTGKPLATPEVPGDCLELWCAAGVLGTVSSDLDLPPDEPNECTTQACVTGAPNFPPVTVATPCGTGGTMFCNATGTCVTCLDDGHCGVAQECFVPTCAQPAGTCSNVPMGSGVACGTMDACNGAGTCVDCVDDTQCGELTPNVCQVRACVGNACQLAAMPDGSVCPTGVCKAATTTCVQCVTNAQCVSPATCQVNNTCA